MEIFGKTYNFDKLIDRQALQKEIRKIEGMLLKLKKIDEQLVALDQEEGDLLADLISGEPADQETP